MMGPLRNEIDPFLQRGEAIPSGVCYFTLTLLAPIETQGSEHWVLIERVYTRPEDLGLLTVPATQREESGSIIGTDVE